VRMMPCRTPSLLVYGRFDGRRPVGRPRKRWLDVVGKDCKQKIMMCDTKKLNWNKIVGSVC